MNIMFYYYYAKLDSNIIVICKPNVSKQAYVQIIRYDVGIMPLG